MSEESACPPNSVNCRVDKCITLKTKGVEVCLQIIYKCVYNRVYYMLHKMQFKESASPERNLILAFENAAQAQMIGGLLTFLVTN